MNTGEREMHLRCLRGTTFFSKISMFSTRARKGNLKRRCVTDGAGLKRRGTDERYCPHFVPWAGVQKLKKIIPLATKRVGGRTQHDDSFEKLFVDEGFGMTPTLSSPTSLYSRKYYGRRRHLTSTNSAADADLEPQGFSALAYVRHAS